MLQKIHLYPPAHDARVSGKMGEFEGEFTGTPFLALLRKGRALFAAGIDSGAKGFLPPQENRNESRA